MIPGCARPYTKPTLDHGYVAGVLGLAVVELVDNLHVIKRRYGFRGKSVWICLDQGDVYDPDTVEYMGNVVDG